MAKFRATFLLRRGDDEAMVSMTLEGEEATIYDKVKRLLGFVRDPAVHRVENLAVWHDDWTRADHTPGHEWSTIPPGEWGVWQSPTNDGKSIDRLITPGTLCSVSNGVEYADGETFEEARAKWNRGERRPIPREAPSGRTEGRWDDFAVDDGRKDDTIEGNSEEEKR